MVWEKEEYQCGRNIFKVLTSNACNFFPCLFFLTFLLSFLFFFPTQYFETDDPEFYKSKVCFILNNDVSEMDLVFAEEKYSKTGQLEKVRRRFLNMGQFNSFQTVPGEAEDCVPQKTELTLGVSKEDLFWVGVQV